MLVFLAKTARVFSVIPKNFNQYYNSKQAKLKKGSSDAELKYTHRVTVYVFDRVLNASWSAIN